MSHAQKHNALHLIGLLSGLHEDNYETLLPCALHVLHETLGFTFTCSLQEQYGAPKTILAIFPDVPGSGIAPAAHGDIELADPFGVMESAGRDAVVERFDATIRNSSPSSPCATLGGDADNATPAKSNDTTAEHGPRPSSPPEMNLPFPPFEPLFPPVSTHASLQGVCAVHVSPTDSAADTADSAAKADGGGPLPRALTKGNDAHHAGGSEKERATHSEAVAPTSPAKDRRAPSCAYQTTFQVLDHTLVATYDAGSAFSVHIRNAFEHYGEELRNYDLRTATLRYCFKAAIIRYGYDFDQDDTPKDSAVLVRNLLYLITNDKEFATHESEKYDL